jgi:energy-coupling factor transport system substrate-specific component
MRELLTMWKNTRMIVFTILLAAIYAAVLIPFKAIPLVPGFTEIRVAQVIPPVASLLFGPAAAWGTAFGNLIADFFGTFSVASLFGFIGNFFLGAIPYVLWGRITVNQEPAMRTTGQVVGFVVVTLVSAVACAAVIAWGADLLQLFPFTVFGTIIAINNAVLPAVVGPILLFLLYGRVKRMGLLWTEVMEPEDIASTGPAALGTAALTIGAVGGWLVGMLVGAGLGLPFGIPGFGAAAQSGQAAVIWTVLPFMVLLVLGLFTARARTEAFGLQSVPAP